MGAGLVGHAAWVTQSQLEKQPIAVGSDPAQKDATRVPAKDLEGDPLPRGAVVRLGKVLTPPLVSLQFLSDGKTADRERSSPGSGWGGANGDPATGKKLGDVSIPSDPGLVDLVSPDGKLLARGQPSKVSLIDLASGKEIRQITLQEREQGVGLCFSPDAKTLAISQPIKRKLELYDVATAKLASSTSCQAMAATKAGMSPTLAPSRGWLIQPMARHWPGMRRTALRPS